MVAPEERLTIDAGSTQVSGVYARPDRPFAAIVVAHGAGAGMDHPFLVGFSRAINELDVATLRFNFPYMERGRRSPDSEPAAIEAWRAALDVASKRGSGLPIFASGKSYGGRMASMAVADGMPVAGLVFLGYPLHPPGKPEDLRAQHLAQIKLPMLFVQGARDAFGTPDELRPIVQTLPLAALHVVEGGDHSFKVRKRDGVAQEVVHEAVLDRIAGWLREKLGPVGEGKIAPGR